MDGATDGGAPGGATDGGGSNSSIKRRGCRGGKKHRKKTKTEDHGDWSNWNRIPGSGNDGSGSSWKKNYTKGGGYLSAARKARGWR